MSNAAHGGMLVPEATQIETATGAFVDLRNPDPATIYLDDIAHGMSMTCRYGGHISRFYCVTPETRVLTDDLRWVPAGDLACGDGLLGFDEFPQRGDGQTRTRRHARHATVLHEGIIQREGYEVELENGTVLRASAEHPWLCALKASRNQSWRTTAELAADVDRGNTRYLLRFFEPWSQATDYESGYLTGLLDGEGHISVRAGGMELGFSQAPGPVLERARNAFENASVRVRANTLPHGVIQLNVSGRWQQLAALLGQLRPVRLVDKLVGLLRAGEWTPDLCSTGLLRVARVTPIGTIDVVALETSTRTYFAEGFGAHNSVAEHAALVHDLLVAQGATWPGILRAALLHDAAEAYLGDVVSPLKYALRIAEYESVLAMCPFDRFAGIYADLTTGIELAIGQALDIEPVLFDHEAIKRADMWALAIEARELTVSRGANWRWPGELPNDGELPGEVMWAAGLAPDLAEQLWTERYGVYEQQRRQDAA